MKRRTAGTALIIGCAMAICVSLVASVSAVIQSSSAIRYAKQATFVQREAPAARANRTTWPTLGQDKTIELAEVIKRETPPPRIVVYCARPDCQALAADIDDAFQIANWPSDIETGAALAPDTPGITIMPKTDAAMRLGAGLANVLPGQLVSMEAAVPPGGAVLVFIGKRR